MCVCVCQFRRAFNFYNENQDGVINATELDTAFRRFGMEEISHHDVEAVLVALEIDANGTLGYEEFLVMMSFFESVDPEPSRHEDSDDDE